jgi:hypothetical protein
MLRGLRSGRWREVPKPHSIATILASTAASSLAVATDGLGSRCCDTSTPEERFVLSSSLLKNLSCRLVYLSFDAFAAGFRLNRGLGRVYRCAVAIWRAIRRLRTEGLSQSSAPSLTCWRKHRSIRLGLAGHNYERTGSSSLVYSTDMTHFSFAFEAGANGRECSHSSTSIVRIALSRRWPHRGSM